MKTNWIKPFIYTAGGILLAAALIRFLIVACHHPALALPEPLLGIPLRYAILAVGTLEIVVAGICLFGKNVRLQAAWLPGWRPISLCLKLASCICTFTRKPPVWAASPTRSNFHADSPGRCGPPALLCAAGQLCGGGGPIFTEANEGNEGGKLRPRGKPA